MKAKSLFVLFMLVLLVLVSGNRVYAQGPYDPAVAAQFSGAWLNLKTGQNYAVVDVSLTSATMRGCAGNLTNCAMKVPSYTQDGKLVASYFIDARDYPDWPYPQGWYALVRIELTILESGHMMSVITESYSFGPVSQRTAEYLRIGDVTTTSTPLPAESATTQVWFHIINRHSQKCLTAMGPNNPVVQKTCANGRDDQLWYLPAGEFQVSLQSKSGVCVGYDPSGAHNTLFGVTCTGPKPWALRKMCDSYGSCLNPLNLSTHTNPIVPPIAYGSYYLMMYSGECVDVDRWTHDESGIVIHETCRDQDNDNQLWSPN